MGRWPGRIPAIAPLFLLWIAADGEKLQGGTHQPPVPTGLTR
jgi:hypothetical protein